MGPAWAQVSLVFMYPTVRITVTSYTAPNDSMISVRELSVTPPPPQMNRS